ncbi:MAG: MotA/TolQ/ExbB proton channel family protein [Fimbriiglobus sp.]
MLSNSLRFLSARRAWLSLIAVALVMLLAPSLGLAQDAPAEGGGEPKSQNNIFIHIITSVGIFWILLLPISVWLVAMVVLLALDLKMSAAIPAGFVDEFTDTVNKRKFKEAYDMARNDTSYLGRTLTAGMARLQYGIEDAREASMNTLEALKSDKEQKNNYTAVIATLGPLLGLVGTVFGMIMAFMELAKPGANPNPSVLAEGISHALAVTLVGVAISVPAIALNTYFRNRITQLMLEVGTVSDDLLTQMYHNSKKPGAPAPAATAQPAPAQAAPAAPK